MSTIDRQAIIDCLSRLVTPGIKLTALADDIGARAETRDPKTMAQHDHQLVARDCFIVREPAPERRRHTEDGQ